MYLGVNKTFCESLKINECSTFTTYVVNFFYKVEMILMYVSDYKSILLQLMNELNFLSWWCVVSWHCTISQSSTCISKARLFFAAPRDTRIDTDRNMYKCQTSLLKGTSVAKHIKVFFGVINTICRFSLSRFRCLDFTLLNDYCVYLSTYVY